MNNKMTEQKKKENEEVKERIEEWGFMKEESKKLMEQRFKMREKMKKKKELSAAEKYALIKQ